MSIRLTIIEQIQQIAAEQEKKLAPLTDDLVLIESGLDSLGFAILVARLEDALGLDPFTASEDVYYPVTLGEFIRFYENAVVPPGVAER
jgi:acyl carrier protein